MALFEIAHFSILWSNLIAWGYWDIFQFYGYVGPLECIFMAPLALFNEGVPGHFSNGPCKILKFLMAALAAVKN